MKKGLLVCLCVLGLAAAGVVSAQTVDFSYLSNLLNNLQQQAAALRASQVGQVSAGANSVNSVVGLLSTVPGCRGTAGFSSTTGQPCSDNSIPTAVTTDRSVGNSVVSLSPAPQPAPSGFCAGGATVPRGSSGRMIYCNGLNWAPTSYLFTNGGSLSQSFDSVTGAPMKNTLGWLGLNGVVSPTEAVDLGGGNIKMGHEIVSSVFPVSNVSSVGGVISCPNTKRIVSGGCIMSGNFGSPRLVNNGPAGNSAWACNWGDVGAGATATGYAICANIR